MKKKTGYVLLISVAALVGNFVAPVFAQETAASKGGDELSEVIVTARRTEENVQDVPISIAVFNQQQLSTEIS